MGKRADFILVGANPLADIQHAADVRGVYTKPLAVGTDLRALPAPRGASCVAH